MRTWIMPEYLTAMRDKLKLRPGLQGVMIYSSPMNHEDIEQETIVFIDVDSLEDYAVIGSSQAKTRNDTFIVNGVIWVQVPGAGEDIAVEARNRAAVLLGELETEIRADPSFGLNVAGTQKVISARVARKELRQGISPSDHYRVGLIEFDIEVKTRI